ncbi:putative Ig domain-containing protein, partial [Candidatus Magnetaquicoccus inordinatus]|uniref:putative Ig domain-containing protein n=1 Tax=Candidatus Magnetaquicoccus inordinatus TaxID=2496818 RepID=UPI00187D27BB
MSTPNLTQGLALPQEMTNSWSAHGSIVPLGGEALLPQASIFLEGEFVREGDHLLITGPNGEHYLVQDYFSGAEPPILTAPNGAFLLPETVSLLLPLEASGMMVAGPVPAPADAAAPAAPGAAPAAAPGGAIGKVKGITGSATARSQGGESRTLKAGDSVFEGEEVKTTDGAQVQLEFVDGTLFQVGAAARVLINKYLFNPAAGQGEFGATVMKGAFSYTSGNLATQHPGRHTLIKTPTAQIGVRGSKFQGNVGEDGKTDLLHNEGVIDVSDKNGNGTVTLLQPGTATVVTLDGGPSPAFVATADFINRLKSMLPTVAPSQTPQQDSHAPTDNVQQTALVQNLLDGYKNSNLDSSMVKGTLGINLDKMTEAERHEFVSDLSQLAQALPPLPAPKLNLSHGVFLDSAVAGIHYSTPTHSGVTDATGGFSFRPGETVTFSVAGVVIGSVSMGADGKLPIVTPDLLAKAATADETLQHNVAVNIVRLLQTLDLDGNPANGIALSDELLANAAKIDFTLSTEDFANNEAVNNLVKELTDSATGELISEKLALQHYQQTLDMLTALSDVKVESASFLYAVEGEALSFHLSPDTFVAPNGATVSYEAKLLGGGGLPTWLTFNAATGELANLTGVLPDDVDTEQAIVIQFSATINGVNADSAAVNYVLMVQNVNEAPELDAAHPLPDLLAYQSANGMQLHLATYLIDPDPHDQLSFTVHYDQGSLPSWLHLTDGVITSSNTELAAHQGVHHLHVMAEDLSGLSKAVTVDFVVDNHAPSVVQAFADQTATQGSVFSLSSSSTFADQDSEVWNDALTYSATVLVGGQTQTLAAASDTSNSFWLKFDSSTGLFSGTPLAADISTNALVVTVTAADRAGVEVSDSFTLTVANGNDAPLLVTPMADQNLIQNKPFSIAVPANTFSDPDLVFADQLSYSATLSDNTALPSWLNFDAASNKFYGTAPATIGDITVKIIATDLAQLSQSDEFVIHVNSLNQSPTYVGGAWSNSTLAQGAGSWSYTLATSDFHDPDAADTLQYSAKWLRNGTPTTLPSWLQFTVDSLSGHMVFSGIPGNSDVGQYTIQVSASDAANAFADNSFQINVTNVNDAPTVVAGGLVSKPVSFNPNSLDPELTISRADMQADFLDLDENVGIDHADLDNLSFTVTLQDGSALPSWVSFNTTTGALTINPTENEIGMLLGVRLTATDTHQASVNDNFLILVTKANTAPTFAAEIGDVKPADSTATDGRIFLYELPVAAFRDADMPYDRLSFSLVGSLPSWLRFDADSHTLIGTPGDADVSTPVTGLKLRATDWAGATVDSDPFSVTINNVNDAPIVKNRMGSVTFETGSTLSYALEKSNSALNVFTDEDVKYGLTVTNSSNAAVVDALSYQAIAIGTTPSWLKFNSTTNSFYIDTTLHSATTLGSDDIGTYTFRVEASDAVGAKVSDVVTFVVKQQNTAPLYHANLFSSTGHNAVEQGSSYLWVLDKGLFTDSDAGDSLTWEATLVNGQALPSWLVFDRVSQTFVGTPQNADVGTLQIKLTVHDKAGIYPSSSATFDLTVGNKNDAPTLTAGKEIPDLFATVGRGFSYTVDGNTFTDIDMAVDPNATLNLSATLADGRALSTTGWLGFDSATRSFSSSGNVPVSASGALTVRVTASDGSLSASDLFNVVINHAPSATLGSISISKHAQQGGSFYYKLPTTLFQDSDLGSGDVLKLSATLLSGPGGLSAGSLPSWLTFNSGSGILVGTPDNAQVGTWSVRVSATDQAGVQASTDLSFVVDNLNDAPTVQSSIGNVWKDSSHNTGVLLQKDLSTVFSDPDSGIDPSNTGKLSYSYTLLGSTGLSDANRPSIAISSAGVLTITAGSALPESELNLMVKATDGGGLSVSELVSLHVIPSSGLQSGNISTQVATQDKGFVFSLPSNAFSVNSGYALSKYPLQLSTKLADGSSLPSWLQFDADSNTFYGKPSSTDLASLPLLTLSTGEKVGKLSLQVTATDKTGVSATDNFDLLVHNSNDAPTINSAVTLSVPDLTQGSAFQYILPQGRFTDSDSKFGDRVDMSAFFSGGSAITTSNAEWLHFDAATNRLYSTSGPTVAGDVSIRLTGTDQSGASVSEVITLHILPPNNAPTISTSLKGYFEATDGNNALVNPLEVGTLFSKQIPSNTFNDADGDKLTYSAFTMDGQDLSAADSTFWLHFDKETGTFFGTPSLQVQSDGTILDDTGVVKVKLIATDSRNASVADLFDITVQNTSNHAPVLVKPV